MPMGKDSSLGKEKINVTGLDGSHSGDIVAIKVVNSNLNEN